MYIDIIEILKFYLAHIYDFSMSKRPMVGLLTFVVNVGGLLFYRYPTREKILGEQISWDNKPTTLPTNLHGTS